MQLQEILQTAARQDASDIHLISGHPPIMRVHTVMTPMDLPLLAPKSVKEYLEQMVSQDQMNRFELEKDLDFSYEVQGLSRYRVNAHYQRGAVGLAMRSIKSDVPPLDDLKKMLVFPTPDPALLAGRAADPDCTVLTDIRPVAAQRQSVFLVRVAVGQALAGGTDINVVSGDIAEVLHPITPLRLDAGGDRLGQGDGDIRLVAGQDLQT